MIQSILDTIARISGLPQPVLAIFAGTLASWGITQRLKTMIPARWSAKAREVSTQAIAFAVGFLATFALFPATNFPASFFAALIVGLWSPALWNVLMLVIGWKWPDLRDALSNPRRS